MSFKTQLTSDLAVFYNSEEFADEVTYTPSGEAGYSINIIIEVSDESLQDPASPQDEMIILVRESDVAAPNVRGDTLTIDSETWYVIENLEGPKPNGCWELLITRSARRQ